MNVRKVIKNKLPEKFIYSRKYRIEKRRMNKTYAEVEQEIGRRFSEVFGRSIDWENPTTLSEKINVAKLYDANSLKMRLTDKILAVSWVKERLGNDSCEFIPLFGAYDSIDEIDFSKLPERYVMKMNNDSGSVFICDEKHPITKDIINKYRYYFQKRNFAYHGYEMQYKDINPKIMIEKYMGEDIRDYKFQCFNGKVHSCRVVFDRLKKRTINFYDRDWNLLPFHKGDIENYLEPVDKPKNYDKMWDLAEKLSLGFDQVRVDFYNIGGVIYFGEMTFTGSNGLEPYKPEKMDYEMGRLWDLDMKTIKERRQKLLSSNARIGD